jgi:hypothetical protein
MPMMPVSQAKEVQTVQMMLHANPLTANNAIPVPRHAHRFSYPRTILLSTHNMSSARDNVISLFETQVILQDRVELEGDALWCASRRYRLDKPDMQQPSSVYSLPVGQKTLKAKGSLRSSNSCVEPRVSMSCAWQGACSLTR